MADVTQVAFQLDNQTLGEIDELATRQASSRAEILRTAVAEMLARRREAAIDAHLEAGYAANPPSDEEDAWAEQSIAGLRAADLDW